MDKGEMAKSDSRRLLIGNVSCGLDDLAHVSGLLCVWSVRALIGRNGPDWLEETALCLTRKKEHHSAKRVFSMAVF